MAYRPGSMKRVGGGRRRGLRGVSGLGLLLVVVGLVYLLVASSLLPVAVLGWWPLIIVGVGAFGLIRRPGWVGELDVQAPGFGSAADRPRRWFSMALVMLGLFLLPFTTHLLAERLIGPIVIVLLGGWLIWRRGLR